MTLVGAAFATAGYETSCGKKVMSVDETFFEGDKIAYEDFMRDINEINCGTRDLPEVINQK